MKNEILLALLVKKVEERLADMPVSSRLRGPRGQRGSPGRDGKDFAFEEHVETFREWAKEFSPKFEDFSADQIEQLRGPKGRDGRDGKDGKDFSLEEHQTYLEELAEKFSLKFEDLTAEHIEKLRGPKGKDGRDGRDFDFESNREGIFNLLSLAVDDVKEYLKLKFSDLSQEDIEQLRGPRGRDGRNGRDFNFEEHRAYFDSLKPMFSDFTPEEVDKLRLHFSDLTQAEKDSLKLRFNDLTDEERLSLRGARGPRGQRGVQGTDGKDGKDGRDGVRGLPGHVGPRGIAGKDGRDGREGRDGKDAPYITDIRLDETRGEIKFIFELSDGTYIETDSVKLPHQTWTVVGGSSGGGGKGGGSGTPGADGKSAYEIAIENGFVGTEAEWLESLIGPAGADGAPGGPGADGLSAYEIAVNDGFEGTEEEWLESLKGEKGDPGDAGAAITFSASIDPAEKVAVDSVPLDDFSAVEFSVALKKGNIRSFMRLVAQKSDDGDFMSEWDHLADVPAIGSLGAIVEKMWESSVSLDIGLEATVVGSDMKLFFTNNEAMAVQVSGTRQPVPDFA